MHEGMHAKACHVHMTHVGLAKHVSTHAVDQTVEADLVLGTTFLIFDPKLLLGYQAKFAVKRCMIYKCVSTS